MIIMLNNNRKGALWIGCEKKYFKKFIFFASIGLFLSFMLLVAGCGNSSSDSDIVNELTPHDPLDIKGEVVIESNLAITSIANTESAVSVTDGGDVTLDNVKIKKTAPEGSMAGVNDNEGDTFNISLDEKKGVEPPQQNTMDQTAGAGGPPGGNNAPSNAGVPDPSLAPDAQGPPGTPGGAPPPGEEDRARGGGSSIGSKGSGVYVGSKGILKITNASIETDSEEGKGLCIIGQGASIAVRTGNVTTTGASSHGAFVAAGGAANLKDVSITTTGEHSSAIATDTGGGKIVVEGGQFSASGKYSAGIYSTGDIRVSNATIRSEVDNVAVMEYGSKISLINTSLWSGKKGAVMIYQSVQDSGGMSEYIMTGGEIISEEGPAFYVTNTNSTINIKNVGISCVSGTLLEVLKGSWGTDVASAEPDRGGTVFFNAENQKLQGDVVLDENSYVTLSLKDKSKLEGSINSNQKGKEVNLTLDASSIWVVTADSFLDKLSIPEVSGSSVSNIKGNGNNVYYDKNLSANLGGKTYELSNGGMLIPN